MDHVFKQHAAAAPPLSDMNEAPVQLVEAAAVGQQTDHWEPTGNHRSGVPEGAQLERRTVRLADIYVPPAQSVQASAPGAWWDEVMFGFHGKHRNDDPFYHRKMEAQLREDPSALPPIVLVETEDGRLEIEDGWHRSSIARHVGIEQLQACIYTLELRAEYAAHERASIDI